MSKEKKYSPKRILLMLIGVFLIGMCVASYRMSGFGVDPFSCMNLGISGFLRISSVSFIITKYTHDRISFRFARVASDLVVILIGVTFCTMAHNSVWEIVGLGTIVNACCNGPLIQFFRDRIEALFQ